MPTALGVEVGRMPYSGAMPESGMLACIIVPRGCQALVVALTLDSDQVDIPQHSFKNLEKAYTLVSALSNHDPNPVSGAFTLNTSLLTLALILTPTPLLWPGASVDSSTLAWGCSAPDETPNYEPGGARCDL